MRELDIWVAAMAAAITNIAGKVYHKTLAKDAASIADAALAEFHERWEWYEGSYGGTWKRKSEPKGKNA